MLQRRRVGLGRSGQTARPAGTTAGKTAWRGMLVGSLLVVLPGVLLVLLLGACATTTIVDLDAPPPRPDGPRVLAVVAHPDDEIAFGGTLYKTATHLGGACDLIVITNGEAGYKYSTLAEALYRRRITDPVVGRLDLPAIRRAELIEGCTILGVRRIGFLDQTDTRYSLDPAEVIGPEGSWDVPRVERHLDRWLAEGDYDFVLTHLPVPETHGHHKAATILALRAVGRLAPDSRPVVLGSYPSGRDEERPAPPIELEGFPETRRAEGTAALVFDRTQPFGYRERLDYRIVVNWAISAHKSQGTMQTMVNRWELETFYPYAMGPADAAARAAEWFAALAQPQFPTLDYDPSGALIEGPIDH